MTAYLKDLTRQKYPLGSVILLCLFFALSSGCSQSDSTIDNYQSRLFKVLSIDEPPTPSTENTEVWRGFDLKKPTTSSNVESINLLEFLGLHGCELQLLVAQKNSGLGKLGAASQKLLNELATLDAIPECIALLESEEKNELADKLSSVIKVKKSQLKEHILRATLYSPEFHSLWSPRTPQEEPYPNDLGPELPQALHALTKMISQWQTSNYLYQVDELEELLSLINRGDGGRLISELMRFATKLQAVNKSLQPYLAANRHCATKGVSFEQKHLDNVIRKYFVGEVQLEYSALERRYYELFEGVHALESQLSEVYGPDYENWKSARDQQVQKARLLPKQHVGLLKQLSECPTS